MFKDKLPVFQLQIPKFPHQRFNIDARNNEYNLKINDLVGIIKPFSKIGVICRVVSSIDEVYYFENVYFTKISLTLEAFSRIKTKEDIPKDQFSSKINIDLLEDEISKNIILINFLFSYS